MSEAVERRLVDLLDHPTRSPFGNPIPGLSGLAEPDESEAADPELPLPGAPLRDVAADEPRPVRILRIAETLQPDESVMWQLHRIGAVPGSEVTVELVGEAFRVATDSGAVELPAVQAGHVVVTSA